MTDSQAVLITVDGTEHVLRFGDISAMDAKDFRAKVGVSLAQALNEGSTDLDVIAGLVWLSRRRVERGLPFEAVAKSLNYDSDVDLAEAEPATAPGRADPE